MLIPHSERKGVNFQLNAFVLAGMLAIVLLVVLGFFYYSTVYTGAARLAGDSSRDLQQTDQQLELVLAELAEVIRVAQVFDQTLDHTLERLELSNGPRDEETRVGAGDLSELSDLQEIAADELAEIRELQSIASMLESSLEPLDRIREAVKSQKALLADLPNYWPVSAGRGRITRHFGPNIHPITNEWFLSKGVEITDSVGVPVVASANGKVTELGFDPNYGLYVWIRHKYGFRTRYSHMQTITVSEGEEVFQGQRIGTLGSSGTATEPYLDFQIWLGTDVVDPAAFLQISHAPMRVLSGR
ncbi:MAG: M23 family metallopeptidase [Spirochaetaceae bacterium]|nr:MAG: M23 family metallopeptidase [Spirochaetaceae bacterium]